MLCSISDLLVEVPAKGGLSSLCREYLADDSRVPDIIIRPEEYRYPTKITVPDETVAYMESGVQFYRGLLQYGGMMLHASAVAYGGKGFLFSGPCGVGKSTHTNLWKTVFGEDAIVFNDDKPALRRLDDEWFAYGTPWSGKNHVNQNIKVPLAGICFLKQGEANRIRRLPSLEALQRILPQTLRKRLSPEEGSLLLCHIDRLILEVPVFELENRPEEAAVLLSYESMRRAAEDLGV